MDPEISGVELLDIAQQALSNDVVQRLEGDPHYMALLIGRAMRMVAREYAQQERSQVARGALLALADGTGDDDRMRALCRNIRDGWHDADPQLHTALWADTAIRTSISRPSLLARTECRLAGLSEDRQSDDAG
jgi:hypothetical protein